MHIHTVALQKRKHESCSFYEEKCVHLGTIAHNCKKFFGTKYQMAGYLAVSESHLVSYCLSSTLHWDDIQAHFQYSGIGDFIPLAAICKLTSGRN